MTYLINVLYILLQVAEVAEHGELVGVVRGCTKEMGFGLRRSDMKMGYILGLRVSPRHRCSALFISLTLIIDNFSTITVYAVEQVLLLVILHILWISLTL